MIHFYVSINGKLNDNSPIQIIHEGKLNLRNTRRELLTKDRNRLP